MSGKTYITCDDLRIIDRFSSRCRSSCHYDADEYGSSYPLCCVEFGDIAIVHCCAFDDDVDNMTQDDVDEILAAKRRKNGNML